MTNNQFKANVDAITYDDVTILRRLRANYDLMIGPLSCSQFRKLMGGDMSYKAKAEKAKKVSQSKTVHYYADMVIDLYNLLKGVSK